MDWEVENKSAAQEKKKKRRGVKIVIIIVVLLLMIMGIRGCVGSRHSSGPLDWPQSGLATMLPKPDSSKGDIITNSDDSLSVDVDNYDESKYEAYIEACKEKGFTVDAKTSTSSYEAYSDAGYHLELSHYTDSMNIDLTAPLEMEEISWPSQGPATLVPKPESTKGKIQSNSSTQFTVSVGNTDKQAFSAYCDACGAVGFNVDFSKGDESYSAKDTTGNSLHVSYEGNNIMTISVSAAKDSGSASAPSGSDASAETSTADAASAASSANVDANGVNADLKAFLDEYEAFMDEYVAFMQKYKDSGDSLSMLSDYTSMVNRYNEFSKKADAYDESTMSDADLAYYLEVTNRVNEKLLSVA